MAESGPRLADRLPSAGRLSSEEILDRFLGWVAEFGFEPTPAQEEALLELMSGCHVVLSTPTGSGKSLVALALHFKALCEGQRSFYTAPIKALVSEKFFALCDQLGPENVGMLTGDASINWGAPVICCTAEVLANMALRQGSAIDAPYVAMDEFHYYADRDRGVAWEIPLLRMPDSTFLLMSATLGNTAAIEEQLHDRSGRAVSHVHSDERPVPLDYAYRETPIVETVETLLGEGRAPLYLVHFTQREAAERAQALTSARITGRDEKRAIAAAISDFRFDTPYGSDISRILRHGVGLHHAGLLPKYRRLVERLAQTGLLKVICGTDTLGVGVNIPIRTVVFSKLCKFDGEKVSILSVRDFKQIAGRAGRRGFDERGSVICQAPEHVIENRQLDAKAAADPGRRRKLVRKKPPTRGFVPWNHETFEDLIRRPPENLESRFRVSHGMLVNCLQGAIEAGDSRAGYRAAVELIRDCHRDDAAKSRLRRDLAQLFRSLHRAGVVEVSRDPATGILGVRVGEDLQRNFSLHQTLSLYLVEALDALDVQSETHALEVLSLVEAILENPRPILQAQVRRARDELLAQLKAEGVPYEERLSRLDEVTYPKPEAEFIRATFDIFVEAHPWAEGHDLQPKSIAREMLESYASFHDTIVRYGLARVEGLLLRYLGQVHSTLAHSVPEAHKTDEVLDLIGFFRATLVRVDSSLVSEWEQMLHPTGPAQDQLKPSPRRPWFEDERALRARVRAELHGLVRALAAGDFEEATRCVKQDPEDAWDDARFKAALAPFYEEYERIAFDPRARQAHRTLIDRTGPTRWRVRQVLLDDQGDDMWNVEGEVDLSTHGSETSDELIVQIRRIGP